MIKQILLIKFPEMVTTVSKDGIVARVVRANIECTNGYIHLIDKVVMKVGNFQTFEQNIKIFNSRGEM